MFDSFLVIFFLNQYLFKGGKSLIMLKYVILFVEQNEIIKNKKLFY